MSNYTIPPRLYATDLAKGKLTQDEIISLQIANDANIAKARKALKMGEVQPLAPAQTKSPEELIADVASQEATARINLERLGFRPQEASQIVTSIRIDPTLDFVSLNANFPAIEADIKKRFNVRLLTPSFFLDYFRKYSQQLEGTIGMKVFDTTGVNGLINTVSELKQILPSAKQFKLLMSRVKNINSNTKEQLNNITNALPSDVDYDRIQQLNPAERLNIISKLVRLAAKLPTKEQVDSADTVQEVNVVADSIPNGLDQKLEEILSEIREVRAVQTPGKGKGGWDGSFDITNDDWIRLDVGGKKAFLKALIERGELTKYTTKDINRMVKPDLDDVWDNLKLSTVEGLSNLGQPLTSTGKLFTPDTTDSIATTGEMSSEVEGLFGRGIMRKPKINLKLKIGKGLSIKQTPSYREYGKYAIHMPQLEQQDILNVKYKSLGQVPKYKPIPVSDVFRDFILDLLENGKPNVRVYNQISPEERKLFEEMSIGAGVWNGLGLKRTTTSMEDEENKRFEILRGEYLAGNNNPKLLSELRRLVVKMMNDSRIKKRQGIELLMELSI